MKVRAGTLLQEIAQLLKQDDSAALELWEANAALLRALHADAGKVEAAIAGFDFEVALALVEDLAAQ